ncbi:hypothetical protein DR950_02175 [Kitasatospora xanthocidica]|uniref:Uncharacterized protein n=1 Tax=Kitasatospora xanthocidica TaxID=83382 RepID=A0A372ZLP2_9ACTN|nr:MULTISPECIES: hypothetical protein [Streptomycetaceae]OKH97200.1 hypothetical protein AMK13_38875 [Streptomyces sp. CB02056]RGD56756.1 hypothetical protein DR950_02175 [Kitasatospora xanthocidica]
MLLELRCAVRRTPPPAPPAEGSGLRHTALSAAFLAVALAGVIALIVLGYAVEALVTVIVTAAVEASGTAVRGRR